MTGKIERTKIDFVRPTPNYLLIIGGGLALLCLLAGCVMAIFAKNWYLAVIFLVSAIALGVLAFLHLREVKKITSGENLLKLSWEIDLPESQRQKLNLEVLSLARILDIAPEEMSDLLSAYIVAEDLALRQIQQEAKMPVLRHVQIGNVPFDGVLINKDLIVCVEVTFLVTPNISQEKINLIMNKMASTKKSFSQLKLGAKMRLLLVLVTQLDQTAEAQLRSSLVKKFGQTPVDVDIRLLDFEALQKIYALD